MKKTAPSPRLQNFIFACALKLQLALKAGREWVTFRQLAEMMDPAWREQGPRRKEAAVRDIKAHMIDIRDLAHDQNLFVAIGNERVKSDRRGKIVNAPVTAEDAYELTAYKRGLPLVGFAMCSEPKGNGLFFTADSLHRQKNALQIVTKHKGRVDDAVSAGFILKSTLKMFNVIPDKNMVK